MEKTNNNQESEILHTQQINSPEPKVNVNPMKAVQTTSMPIKLEFANDQTENKTKAEGE